MAALLFAGLMPVHGEDEIYDAVIRLHVLANSDTAEDQALKLEVRDAVLEQAQALLDDPNNASSTAVVSAMIELSSD